VKVNPTIHKNYSRIQLPRVSHHRLPSTQNTKDLLTEEVGPPTDPETLAKIALSNLRTSAQCINAQFSHWEISHQFHKAKYFRSSSARNQLTNECSGAKWEMMQWSLDFLVREGASRVHAARRDARSIVGVEYKSNIPSVSCTVPRRIHSFIIRLQMMLASYSWIDFCLAEISTTSLYVLLLLRSTL
jgi:hypothetical protein